MPGLAHYQIPYQFKIFLYINFRRNLKLAKEEHDQIFIEESTIPTNGIGNEAKVNDKPYLGSTYHSEATLKEMIEYNSSHDNMFENVTHFSAVNYWKHLIYLRKRTQKLCQGTVRKGIFI